MLKIECYSYAKVIVRAGNRTRTQLYRSPRRRPLRRTDPLQCYSTLTHTYVASPFILFLCWIAYAASISNKTRRFGQCLHDNEAQWDQLENGA